MSDIIFVHPAFREYRRELFMLLEKTFSTRFIFVEDYEHNTQVLPTSGLKRWKILKGGRFFVYRKGAAWGIIKDLVFGSYDIWIASGLNHFTTHLAFLFVKFRRKKFILFSEDWWLSKNMKTFLALPYMKFIARRADAIIATGTRSQKFFLSLGVSANKIFVGVNALENKLHNIDVKRLQLLEDSVGIHTIRKTHTVILYMGRIVPYKGLDILLKAFKKVELERNDVFLLIIGDGDFSPYCKGLAYDLEIFNIKFHPWVSSKDAPLYYLLSDIFVLPTRFIPQENVVGEAWGFVINEALQAGTAVITTTAVAAADDLIISGKTGLIIPAGDINQLSEAILLLLKNIAMRRDMGEAAKKYMSQFLPTHQCDAFKSALKSFNKTA